MRGPRVGEESSAGGVASQASEAKPSPVRPDISRDRVGRVPTVAEKERYGQRRGPDAASTLHGRLYITRVQANPLHGRGPALRSTCKRLSQRIKTSRRRSTAPRPVVQWKFTQTAWPAPMIRLRRGIIGNPLTKPWPDPSWSSRPMPGRDHLAPPAGIAPAGSATGRARYVAPIAAAPTILKTCRQTSENSFGPVPSQSSAPQ